MSSKPKQTAKRKPTTATPHNSPSKSSKKHSTNSPAGSGGQRSLDFFFANQRQRQLELEQEVYGDPVETGGARESVPEVEVGGLRVAKTVTGEEEAESVVTHHDNPFGVMADKAKDIPSLPSSQAEPNDTATFSVPPPSPHPTLSSISNPITHQPLITDIHLFNPDIYPTSTLWPTPTQTPYSHLCNAFTHISSTTSRILILTILTNTLRVILAHAPADLLPTIWLCSNAIAPPHKGIELGIGPQVLIKAITGVSGTTARNLKSLYDKHGDWGDVAFAAKVSVRTLVQPKPLTVNYVYTTLRSIAALRGQGTLDARAGLVKRLLLAAMGEEVRYLTRTFVANLRVGAVRTTVLAALARACVLTRPRDAVGLVAHDALVRIEGDSKEVVVEKMRRAEVALRECYAQFPDWDGIVPWLIECGDVGRTAERCKIMVCVPLRPMLGKITRDLADVFAKLEGREFACEFKYDGQRAQIHMNTDGTVKIFSRHLEDITDKYPDIVALVPQIIVTDVTSFVMDTEVVAVDEEGRTKSFQALSNRAKKNVVLGGISVHVCVYAFDLMYLNAQPLLTQPLRLRRTLLRTCFRELDARFRLVRHLDAVGTTDAQDDVLVFFKESIEAGCEGIMVKVLDRMGGKLGIEGGGNEAEAEDEDVGKSKGKEKQKEKNGKGNGSGVAGRRKELLASYEPDKRLESWLKVKKDYVDGVSDSLDLVPIGAWYGNGRKVGWYSPILLAVYNPENETYESMCKCMSGFSDALYKEMLTSYTRENGRIIDRPKNYYVVDERALRPDVWFEPYEVWEIKGADITLSPVHKASVGRADDDRGLSLRFPRFVRKRDDKCPEDATTAEQLVEMYRVQVARVGVGKERMGQMQGEEEGEDENAEGWVEEGAEEEGS